MSIEAMKQALEALENIDRWLPTVGQKGLRDYEADAIQALRQAIEQAEKRNCDNCESLRLAAWDRINELENKLAEEREACAKVAESYEPRCDSCPNGVATAIRSRGIDGAKVGEVGVWGENLVKREERNA